MGSPQMNFFERCRLERVNDEYFLTLLGVRLPLPQETQCKLLQNGVQSCEVTAGIRPEDVCLAAENDAYCIKANLDVSEMLGNEVLLHLRAGEENFIIRIPESDSGRLTQTNAPQIPLELTISRNKIHLFDAETKDNLI
jgi:multiple sugar transport system ATP-binding protein